MKIVVTGGTGMVGSSFNDVDTDHNIVLVGSKDADLLQQGSFTEVLKREKPDAVIHLAAKVGGVKGNTDFIADFYHQNALMNCNVLNECNNFGIPRVVSLLSTCVYPDKATYPLTEDQIHDGRPHDSNFGYAYAKRMLDVHSRAIRLQYGRDYTCVVPNNIYGPFDNYDIENGHVIPSITRKIWEAKKTGKNAVLWGDGTPLREFTFSTDIAKSLLFCLENAEVPPLCNIGNTTETSIKDVANYICQTLEYDIEDIEWDVSKPAGQFRKPSSSKLLEESGYDTSTYTSLEEGLKLTCEWFVRSYPAVRGIK